MSLFASATFRICLSAHRPPTLFSPVIRVIRIRWKARMEKTLENFDLEYDEDGGEPVVTITLATDRHNAIPRNPQSRRAARNEIREHQGSLQNFYDDPHFHRNKLRGGYPTGTTRSLAQLGCGVATGTESEGSRRIDLATCNTPRIPISWLLPSNVMTVKLNQSICLHRSYRSTIIQ